MFFFAIFDLSPITLCYISFLIIFISTKTLQMSLLTWHVDLPYCQGGNFYPRHFFLLLSDVVIEKKSKASNDVL